MAAYPFTTFSQGSTGDLEDGRLLVRASNGALKARQMFPADKKSFVLYHRLKAAEKTTLTNFYGTNRDITWTLVFDGGTSTCIFDGPPELRPLPGSLYNVTVKAKEV